MELSTNWWAHPADPPRRLVSAEMGNGKYMMYWQKPGEDNHFGDYNIKEENLLDAFKAKLELSGDAEHYEIYSDEQLEGTKLAIF